jgi:CHAT domain-containing protein
MLAICVAGQSSDADCNRLQRIKVLKQELTESKDHHLAIQLSQLYRRELLLDSAEVYYDKALLLNQNDSIRIYYMLTSGNHYQEPSDYDSLVAELEIQYDSLHPFSAIILAKKAEQLNYESKYKSALPLIDRSVQILSKLRSSFDREYMHAQLVKMASMGNTNQLDSALLIGKQMGNYMRKQHSPCAYQYIQLLITMANRYDEKEQLDSVSVYLQKARVILDEFYLANDPLYKLLYNKLGEHYNAKGKPDLALETYLKAEQIALLNVEQNRKLLSTIYNKIASTYRDLHSNQKALQYFNKSIQMLQDEYGDNAPLLLAPFTNMGISLMSMNEYEEASHYLDQALNNALNLMGEDHLYTAIITGAIASNASESGNFVKAEPYFLRSLKIRDKLYGPESIRHANIYINMSVMYRDMENYTKAKKTLKKGLDIYVRERGETHPEVSGIYNRMGILHSLLGNNREAILQYSTGMKVGKMHDPKLEDYDLLTHLTLLKNRSKAYLKLYHETQQLADLDLANEDIKHGTNLLNETLSNSIYTDAADEIISRYRELFETGIDILAELNQENLDPELIASAWQMNDRTKSTSIRNALAEINAIQFLGLDQKLLDEIRETNLRLTSLLAKRKQIEDNKVLANTIDSLVVHQDKLDSLERKLQVTSPEYYRLQKADALVSIDEIQSDLRQDEIILDYFMTEEKLYVFSLTNLECKFVSYPCGEALRDSIANYTNDLSSQNPSNNSKISNWLYNTVKGQITAEIKFVKIIPDGPLSYLPFESLQNSNGKLLIEDLAISYAHSLSILNYQKQKIKKETRFNYAGFAPIYEEESIDTTAQPKYALLVRSGQLPLPNAQREVAQIKEIIGGKNFIGKHARKDEFIKMLGQSKVTHLSMHTLIDASNPLNSRFLFSQANGELEDLYLYELYNLRSEIQLAVLSACETSVGKVDYSGSPNSLSNALAHSGIPATVTSLWKVPDESTSDIMVSFYKYLKDGNRKDEALRLAKLDYLKNAKSPAQKSPLYWAGFVAVGNMEEMTFNPSFNYWWIAAFFVFISILLFLVKKYRPR